MTELSAMGGLVVPLQSLLKQCQVLFQPPDLLPLDPGYVPVPVHVPNDTKTTAGASVFYMPSAVFPLKRQIV